MKKSPAIKHLFEKRVDFENNETFHLPSEAFVATKWSAPSFQNEKEDLNRTKSLLNDFNLEEWSKHTKHRDASSYIARIVKKKFHAELVTQAWCKFYECLKTFAVVPKEAVLSGLFTSVHLCEAPGAFISALNHFLASEGLGVEWKWWANTLNPDHEGNSLQEMIPDDRLLRHTYQNWEFGVDFTGDITKYHNHEDLVKKLQDKIWLVTADGSVDCSSDPGNQELFVEFLHYCETMTALRLLKKGGTFILKIFTSFEDATICLLYLLTALFEKVSTFKPASSKGGNSEVYIICVGYKGVPEFLDSLILPYKNGRFDPERSMFDLRGLNRDFLNQLLKICVFFKTKQVETIRGNIAKYKKETPEESGKVHQVKVYVANRFINRFRVKSIDPGRKLGSFEGGYLQIDSKRLNFKERVFKFPATTVLRSDSFHLDIKIGERISEVNSSLFCLKHHLFKFRYTGGPKNTLFHMVENRLTASTLITLHDSKIETNDEFQKRVFYTIFNSSKNHLVLVKIPLVTSFLVGLLYILVSVYEEVYFHQSGFLVLYDFSGEKIKLVRSVLQSVDEAYRTLPEFGGFTCDIVQLVAPGLLHHNSFFDFVWNYNNIVLSKFK